METENHLSHKFLQFYDKTVMPVAEKCANGFKTIASLERGETIDETSEEFLYIKNHKDASGIYYIGLMIGDISIYRIKGIRLNLINSLSMVNSCLNSESYWTNVWGNDLSSDEAKNLKELAILMKELVKLL